MSSNTNPNVPDYTSAADWAQNYAKKSKDNNNGKDNSINIFWITIKICFYII